jgi:hypothetical protein
VGGIGGSHYQMEYSPKENDSDRARVPDAEEKDRQTAKTGNRQIPEKVVCRFEGGSQGLVPSHSEPKGKGEYRRRQKTCHDPEAADSNLRKKIFDVDFFGRPHDLERRWIELLKNFCREI